MKPPRCAFALVLALAGCSDHMSTDSKLDGSVKGDLKGDVAFKGDMNGDIKATLKIDGPLTMQLQGPTVKYDGTYISDEIFAAVKVGKTTDDWLVAVFGEPDARAKLRDGTEIWRWTYRPTEQQTAVVEVFSDEKKQPKLATRTVFVQISEGKVVEKWKG